MCVLLEVKSNEESLTEQHENHVKNKSAVSFWKSGRYNEEKRRMQWESRNKTKRNTRNKYEKNI